VLFRSVDSSLMTMPTLVNQEEAKSTELLALGSPEMDGSTFEELMKERTRIRKEREEYSVAELRMKIQKLEQALTAEVKRRLNATHSLEERTKQHIADMEERLVARMETMNSKLSTKLADVEERLTSLEESIDKDYEYHKQQVDIQSAAFQESLVQVQRDMEQEKKSRLIREGRLLQQVETHAKELEQLYKEEQELRISEISKLTGTLSSQTSLLQEQQLGWEAQIQAELSGLQGDLEREITERQVEDEAIVAALNQYTQQLQQSLNILNDE